MIQRIALTLALLMPVSAVAQTATAAFDAVDQWQGTLTATSIASLPQLYSTDPPAKFVAKGQKPSTDISPQTHFWQKLVASGTTGFEVRTVEQQDKNGLHIMTLAVSMN